MSDHHATMQAGRYVLADVTIPACLLAEAPRGLQADAQGLARADIVIAEGRIAAITAPGAAPADMPLLPMAGRMAWPCPLDVHTHLDKGHIWPRQPNPDGTFMGALNAVGADRLANWNAADMRARAGFGLACSYAQGTRAIRTHLDSIAPQAAISWPLFAELREEWRGRIELQMVSLAMPEHYEGQKGIELADLAARHGGVLGLVPVMQPGMEAMLDRFLRLAMDRGLDVDCHVDETREQAQRSLLYLAQAAIRVGFQGRIVTGHCCSLALQEPDEIDRTLDLVARAGIAVVSLPMCNMYLQDRTAGRTPRWRGVTLLHEMKARGVPVMVASDNCRDPFYAYGDHDLHEVFREAVRIVQLDHPVGDWISTVTTTPASIMHLDGLGSLAQGAAADLILFCGRDWSEVLSRNEAGRTVLRDGRPIDRTLPDYAALDEVLGR